MSMKLRPTLPELLSSFLIIYKKSLGLVAVVVVVKMFGVVVVVVVALLAKVMVVVVALVAACCNDRSSRSPTILLQILQVMAVAVVGCDGVISFVNVVNVFSSVSILYYCMVLWCDITHWFKNANLSKVRNFAVHIHVQSKIFLLSSKEV